MNKLFNSIITESSTANQDGLADLVQDFVVSHAAVPNFTEDEVPELKRRHVEPFDPAPEREVREFFARNRG